MKHFPSIMFHLNKQPLIFRYLHSSLIGIIFILLNNVTVKAQAPLPYAAWFNPEKGFKPAQRSLTDIFLQMAGSFEYYGTPEPYIRHVMAEHARIDAKYKQATGKDGSSRPTYLTDAYIENLLAGWNKLAPTLNFESLCKVSGKNMRYAIMGGWNKSPDELATDETRLSENEKSTYGSFLKKDYFKKADFDDLETFYSVIWDKLSEDGKAQISKRTRRGTLSPDQRQEAIKADQHGTIIIAIFNEHQKRTLDFLASKTTEKINSDTLQEALVRKLQLNRQDAVWTSLPAEERDAVRYSHTIEDAFSKRFDHVRKEAQTPEQATNIEKAMLLMTTNLLAIAQSEFEAALDDELADRIIQKRN